MSNRALFTACLALVLAACGGAPDDSGALVLDESALTSRNGLSTNGLSTNGLSTNGLSTNGLSTNGLSTNGLSTNGLSTSGFITWFTTQSGGIAYTNMVMTYVVRCALNSGESLSYTTGGITYTWTGNLGLAPTWASGQPIPVVEQRLVSACLAAHANKFGVEVAISVRGFFKDGVTQIPVGTDEVETYTVKEGCFFGNLFSGAGIFSAYENSTLSLGANSSYRACAFSNGGVGLCPNLPSTGKLCSSICHQLSGSSNTGIWNTCTWNGVAYPAITTRILPSSVNTCGSGSCHATETCYDNNTGYGCQTDCGKCP